MRKFSGQLAVSGLVLAGFGVAVGAQQASAPIARYEMRAETVSGIGGMGAGGGMGAAMAMAFGGTPKAQHMLWLDLGSSRSAADGKPKAEHFMPAGAKLGKSVLLRTPEPGKSAPPEPGEKDFQRPKGRMLIFWGCGERAPKGQPVVIDFSKLAAGQVPPGLFTSSVPLDRMVSPSASKTYGYWPGADGKSAKPDSVLVGAHRVAGNYSPEMAFSLAKDFMGPLNASNTQQASGSTLLRWGAVPDATGYYAMIIGGKQSGKGDEMADMVWWSSSASRQFGGGLADWMAPATVARLVTDKTVLSPQTTSCTVPAEVKAAAPDFMYGTLHAYGPEESFAYPPRPADPKIRWVPEWTARIRHRSTTGFLVGMEGFGAGPATSGEQAKAECKPKKKKGFGGLLGGAMAGALGVPNGSDDGC
ncbi:MAG: hypothetical protein B7Y36_04025 [Novosphingobium sp. 28-62-57]|nr:MAG: hypothetical protein B7Z34_11165 [Novosphingobium sp. 12-62-10]OYZ12666.1 MAG: hypothetical protein B7Y36_04025 [Novosphingobium sp. 28-62-57]OZA39665.1 MAG: hypothetical protein B7X92_02410 [Novosphingobium sp. 17-62-9]HQS68609.1 hypothetical protein [Novosphingobium sp.]